MKLQKVNLEFLDKHKVRFTCYYPVSKERLWNALSNTEELDQWFMKTEWDFQVGGRFTFEGGWEGWIEKLSELKFVQFNSSTEAFTRFDLKPLENGTELYLTDQIPKDLVAHPDGTMPNIQPGGPGTHWVGLLAGWEDFLLALGSHLANERIEDHFDHLCVTYKKLLQKKYGSAQNNTAKSK